MAIQYCMFCGIAVYDNPLLDQDEKTICDTCLIARTSGKGTPNMDDVKKGREDNDTNKDNAKRTWRNKG